MILQRQFEVTQWRGKSNMKNSSKIVIGILTFVILIYVINIQKPNEQVILNSFSATATLLKNDPSDEDFQVALENCNEMRKNTEGKGNKAFANYYYYYIKQLHNSFCDKEYKLKLNSSGLHKLINSHFDSVMKNALRKNAAYLNGETLLLIVYQTIFT